MHKKINWKYYILFISAFIFLTFFLSVKPITPREIAPRLPYITGQAKVKAAPDNYNRFYSGVQQFGVSDGISGKLQIVAPILRSPDRSSLTEIAAESSDGKQIIEVGFITYGNYSYLGVLLSTQGPELFVSHWINGAWTCNNGCGFVQVSTKYRPGMALKPSSTPQQFSIQQINNRWYIFYQNTIVGYFPDSLWPNNAFTKVNAAQYFGEIATPNSIPCSQMGNGVYGSQTGSAKITNIGFISNNVPLLQGNVTNAKYYNIGHLTTNSLTYGGNGGQCALQHPYPSPYPCQLQDNGMYRCGVNSYTPK